MLYIQTRWCVKLFVVLSRKECTCLSKLLQYLSGIWSWKMKHVDIRINLTTQNLMLPVGTHSANDTIWIEPYNSGK